jgi:PKD repeat protein
MITANNYDEVMKVSVSILKQFLQKTTFLTLAIPILFATALLASVDARAGDIDIDRASWSNDRNQLTVRGEDARDNDIVTIRYGEKDDNGAVIGTTRADGDGDWVFRITGIDPVPCDVTAEDSRDDDDKEVRRAPGDCSNDGGAVPPANVPPTANANGPYTGTTDVPVSFSSAGSNDSDGTITNFTWDFGDGSTSNNANPSHAYAAAGTYDVTLTVTDNDGATDSDATTATIDDQPPVQACNIAVSPTTLAFGNVTVGSPSTLSTTVSNSGAAACSVTLARNGSNDFAITSATSFNVAPGGSQNVSVSYTPGEPGADTGTLQVNSNDPDTATVNVGLSGNGVDEQVVECIPVTNGLSINSTSQDGCPEQLVPEVNTVLNSAFRVLAINDLGMHCGDLDTRISSILPPFQVLLGQVIERGATPTLNPAGVSLEYSAASNPNDPILGVPNVQRGLKADGSTYKTNFWDVVGGGAYDPFYPSIVTPLLTGPFPVTHDIGLPVPNAEELYIGPDGQVLSGDESLTAVQHAMPGLAVPYFLNDPQTVNEHYGDKPFFVNFPFGYVAADVNWYEAAGIPFAAYDDYGRENAYPLVRVEAKQGTTTVGTVDTVLPISGEASCTNCHSDPADVQNSRTSEPTDTLNNAGLPVATSLDDPDPTLPNDVSVEYAADINILRLHDLKHGANYVDTSNNDTNCLINKALVQGNAVVCQVCHYTPALDLAQVGPVAGPPGTDANGRNQLAHSSNSNVMHSHHGGLGNLFPPMPAPIQQANGTISNQAERLQVLEDTCYQCHPGTNVQCLRGAMFNGGMLCNDCHGDMEQVGNDFSAGVSPQNPGAFVLGGDFYDPNDPQPRVPWANEPGCGSCHTGDVRDNLAGTAGTIANTRDIDGNVDNLRLRQAYVSGDAKATPIVPTNKRFAEPAVPASFNGFANPGAGNPQLYRVSTGHGGVMCEGCHGATHAEFPNGNPDANDNVMANQLQGHTGPIVECDTCHTNINALGTDGSTASLQGPHGMHVVGNTQFADGEHRRNINRNACRDCHGQNGEGSVLSRTAADRNLPDVGFVPKGTPITCTMCHGNEL